MGQEKQDNEILIKRILTKEDWYPTTNGKVEVTLLYLPEYGDPENPPPNRWRVFVEVGDDFAFGIDKEDEKEAYDIYRKIVDGTTKARLETRGLGDI